MTEAATEKKQAQNEELAAMRRVDKIVSDLPSHRAGIRVLEWCIAQHYDREAPKLPLPTLQAGEVVL